MDTFETRAAKVAIEDVGDGPALVFLHNGGTSSTIWRHQVAAFRDRYQVVTVDLPGFGASERPRQPLDLDGLVELVAAIIDERVGGPAVVVGNCMGSNIAAGLAVQRPDLVSGLVLINPLTAATFSAGHLGPLHKVHRWARTPSRWGRSVARRIVPPKLSASATLRFQVGSKGVARRVHRDPELLACCQRREQLPALIDVLDDMDAYGGLDVGLDLSGVPVCTVWGQQNRVLSPKVGRRLDERLHPVRTASLEGCGHLPMLEDPDAVNDVIVRFLQQDLGEVATTGARGSAR